VSIPGGGAPRTGGGAVVECPETTRLDIENRRSAGATHHASRRLRGCMKATSREGFPRRIRDVGRFRVRPAFEPTRRL